MTTHETVRDAVDEIADALRNAADGFAVYDVSSDGEEIEGPMQSTRSDDAGLRGTFHVVPEVEQDSGEFAGRFEVTWADEAGASRGYGFAVDVDDVLVILRDAQFEPLVLVSELDA